MSAKRFLIVPPNYEIALGISKVVEFTREQAVDLIYRNNLHAMTWRVAEKMTDAQINGLLVEAYERQKVADAARYQLVVA